MMAAVDPALGGARVCIAALIAAPSGGESELLEAVMMRMTTVMTTEIDAA